jgi:16S rRNA (guanine527-N7)-methyltransferase
MTEAEAQAWLMARGWWESEGGDRLRAFIALLLAEADRQNLISAASRAEMLARHIVDSAQLLALAPADHAAKLWVDLGTGAGLPGLVIACLRPAPIVMIEARPLRVAFLEHCVATLGLRHARVIGDKVERVTLDAPAGIVSARAYAPMERLLPSAVHLADSSTAWLLPKGRNAQKELAIAQRHWQALFHVEQSVTDPESAIVIIQSLRQAPNGQAPSGQAPSGRRASGRPTAARTSSGRRRRS